MVGGPGIEPGPARYQRAVPPRTPTSDESSGGRARTCSSRLTVARRTRSTSPERRRKERESNPQRPKPHPFSRRDTAPVAVLPEVAPAGVEPATRRLRVGSSAELSYGAVEWDKEVWPAGIEPAARRVSGDRSTVLSYGHA